jgi:integrative and conjugative element protein (TIGR02256 family)
MTWSHAHAVRADLPTLWLARLARAEMIGEAARWPSRETGGVLLGYWGGDQALVTRAVGPGPDATHGMASFLPDQGFHEEVIALHYERTGRTETYLGDWHSHPGGSGRLSRLDRRTLKRIASFPGARAKRAVMIIVHGEALDDMSCWVSSSPGLGLGPRGVSAVCVV